MPGELRWTDDHCHLPDDGSVDEVLAAARAAGVERLVHVGTDLASSRAAVALATAHDGVWATAGVHPHEARHGVDGIEELLSDPSCVAVGECGFDFHYDHSPRDAQRDVFAAQIALAHAHDKALVIHTREAWAETFEVLDAEGVPARTVFHCFTGGADEADECLARGAFLSFSGIVTFPSAHDVRAAAARCPLDRMLVETDSPYLAPVPKRGRTNEPGWVPLVGAGLADASGHDLAVVAEATWRNAERCYRLA
ncbi:TatD family hydrolase [Acidimicrobiia bacterium EGI L10123]|uniref:TatD family hydrolase n=1 Tax=Salinilacustrithrix flava TaxID=2957203 RepID=UPI003D7C2B95|nr:TatD family hydrolase [Acidimicrobiia bacterium EGI L10123]